MSLLDFTLRMLIALALGVFIGLERQWKQHLGSLRTSGLVSIGSALFVSLSELVLHTNSDVFRIAAAIPSGVAFLCMSFIWKEETAGKIRGLNTAASLWCSAAIGTLAGSGFGAFAAIGSVLIVITNTCLRPIANRLTKAGDDTDG